MVKAMKSDLLEDEALSKRGNSSPNKIDSLQMELHRVQEEY